MSSKPMIAVKDEEGRSKVVANLLPCRIHHDGPVDTLGSFWQPTEAPSTAAHHSILSVFRFTDIL